MKRKPSLLIVQRNQSLLSRIRELKQDHPLWGYRRVWSYLVYREGLDVNKKRIYRLMRENALLVTKNVRLKARRGPFKSKPRADRPNQFWGIDMTKMKLSSWGWFYLVVVLDWYTKEIVGYSLKMQSKSEDWLEALNLAVNHRFPQGIHAYQDKPRLISDNGCQPTSEKFMKSCATLDIKQIFTTWSNPKGNADTERVFRTLKEDFLWPRDWDNPFLFAAALEKWIDDYNTDFPHQSLNNLTPEQYYKKHLNPARQQSGWQEPLLTNKSLA